MWVVVAVAGARAGAWLAVVAAMRLLLAVVVVEGTVPGTDIAASTSLQIHSRQQHHQ
jgi:hypothetical protein